MQLYCYDGAGVLCNFDYGIDYLGYQTPMDAAVPVQNEGVQSFISFCVIWI